MYKHYYIKAGSSMSRLDRMRIQVMEWSYFCGNLCVHWVTRLLFRPVKAPEHLLIFRNGSLGDSICAMPAIGAIRVRWPTSKITIFSAAGDRQTGIQDVLPKDWGVEFITYKKGDIGQLKAYLALAKDIQLIVLPQYGRFLWHTFREMFWFRSMGIRYAAGWHWEMVPLFRHTQFKHTTWLPESERLLTILHEQALVSALNPPFFAESSGVTKMVVALCPGAALPWKAWPLAKWKMLSERLVQLGYEVWVVGGVSEKEVGSHLAQPNIKDYTGTTSVQATSDYFQQCSLVVSNDSGPLHLAYANGIPTIGLFTQWHFKGMWSPPKSVTARVIHGKTLPCAGCFTGCAAAPCMSEIEVEDVWKAVQSLLPFDQNAEFS